MIRAFLLVALLSSCLIKLEAFTSHRRVEQRRLLGPLLSTESDPPPLSEEEIQEIEEDFKRKKAEFRKFVEDAVATTNPEHLPKLLAKNMDVIAALQGQEGADAITEIVEDSKSEGEEQFNRTVMVIEAILSFAESFVQEAEKMDMKNKKLLGKIINAMKTSEDAMDELMDAERENFSSGFLRHIEGECNRIANAPKMTAESTRLVETLRVIQARVLEEIGAEMGEATLVLGQLMGYDNREELIGVLDAGLTVQGREFAVEMKGLTEEALRGFESVHGGVEQELVERVSFVDQRLKEYLEESNQFQ